MKDEPRFRLRRGIPIPISRHRKLSPMARVKTLSAVAAATGLSKAHLLQIHAMAWPGEGYSKYRVSLRAVLDALKIDDPELRQLATH